MGPEERAGNARVEYHKVGEVQTSKSGKVVVQTYTGSDGVRRVDIRLFVVSAKEGGYSGPTKKGTSLPVENLPMLMEILSKVQ